MLYYLPLYFQSVDNVSASESGIRNIPLVLGVGEYFGGRSGICTSADIRSLLHNPVRWTYFSLWRLRSVPPGG